MCIGPFGILLGMMGSTNAILNGTVQRIKYCSRLTKDNEHMSDGVLQIH